MGKIQIIFMIVAIILELATIILKDYIIGLLWLALISLWIALFVGDRK